MTRVLTAVKKAVVGKDKDSMDWLEESLKNSRWNYDWHFMVMKKFRDECEHYQFQGWSWRVKVGKEGEYVEELAEEGGTAGKGKGRISRMVCLTLGNGCGNTSEERTSRVARS